MLVKLSKIMHHYKTDYSILAFLALGYLATIYKYQTFPKYVFLATLLFALSYLIWGAIHHLRLHNFNLRIMLEYLLVATLGVVIISTLLL